MAVKMNRERKNGSNKIQDGDILVQANPGPPGKWPLKLREKKTEIMLINLRRYQITAFK